jgi:hypothetical protein
MRSACTPSSSEEDEARAVKSAADVTFTIADQTEMYVVNSE